MTFKKGIFKKGNIRRKMLFDSCAECGHKFKVGETIFRRLTVHKSHVYAYLCEECYEGKFIDL